MFQEIDLSAQMHKCEAPGIVMGLNLEYITIPGEH